MSFTMRSLIMFMWALLATLCMYVSAQGQTRLSYQLLEELHSDHLVGDVRTDANLDDGGTLQILPGRYRGLFHITDLGVLHTARSLDREVICSGGDTCQMELGIAASWQATRFEVVRVTVTLVDVNDNSPTFTHEQFRFTIPETAAIGTEVVLPHAVDRDGGNFTVQRFQLGGDETIFGLSSEVTRATRLILLSPLDRETVDAYTLTLTAYDGGDPSLFGSTIINITVADANDNIPVFHPSHYRTTVSENAQPGSIVATVYATDNDTGANGAVRYSFTAHTALSYGNLFTINATTGEISLRGGLDYEESPSYQLMVTAQDEGDNSVPTHVTVEVIVFDVNDHPPVIHVNGLREDGLIQVSESATVGSFFAHVSISDADGGDNFTCVLRGNEFSLLHLYAGEYKMVTATILDRERFESHAAEIECVDGGTPALSGYATMTVEIADVNDCTPQLERSVYAASLRENGTSRAAVVVVSATDCDIGENAAIMYSLHGPGQQWLMIDPHSGVISTTQPLDREESDSFECIVVATDGGTPALSSTATVRITVIDINDESPEFSQPDYKFGLFENQPSGTEIGVVRAVDRDTSPFDEIVFSLTADPQHPSSVLGFQVDPYSGRVTMAMPLDRELNMTHTFIVIASNTAEPRLSSAVNVSVFVADRNDNGPVFPSDIMSVQVSVHAPIGYAFARISANDVDQGENARLTYTVVAGDSLSLFHMDAPSGLLSVSSLMRDAGGQHRLVVMVTDHGDPPLTATATVVITVNASLPFAEVDVADSQPRRQLLGFHQRVILALGVTTGIIVVLLLTAIVAIRRRQIQQDKDAYQCVRRHGSSDESDLESKFDRPPLGGVLGSEKESRNHITLQDLQQARQQIEPKGTTCPVTDTRLHPGIPYRNDHISRLSLPPELRNKRHVEVHHLLALLGRDLDCGTDSASGCSAELSNADSGHGASDEGDTNVQPQRPPPAAVVGGFDVHNNSFRSAPSPCNGGESKPRRSTRAHGHPPPEPPSKHCTHERPCDDNVRMSSLPLVSDDADDGSSTSGSYTVSLDNDFVALDV